MKAYLEPSEVERMEEAAQYLRDRLLVRLLFRLGCRISEALGIGVEDIDFERGTVTIAHLKVRVTLLCAGCKSRLSKTSRFCPRCGLEVKPVTLQREQRRVRTLPLDPDTLNLLREYIDRGGPVAKNGRLLLFEFNRHRAWQIVRDCARSACLPALVNPETGKCRGISPHRLRDAFAVNAVKADDSGDGLRLLQEHLGHAGFNTTAKYRKVSGREHQEWYGKLWQGPGTNGGDPEHVVPNGVQPRGINPKGDVGEA